MMHFCSVPYIYTLEITSSCNARCVGCGNVFSHDSSYITSQNCQLILERISPYVEMLRITGGEPTLSPAFAQILQAVDQLVKPIVVFTNGLWNEPEFVIKSLQACRNLDGILVSLHGQSALSYQAFTRGNHFSTVLSNIRRVSEAGIAVNTNTILTHHNIGHMSEVVELATQAGAQIVAFSRYYGIPLPGLTDLSPEHFKFAIDQIVQLRVAGKRVKFNNNIPLCLGSTLTKACPAGDTHCTISPTCKVRICNHSPYEVGDILETPIEQIWQSERLQEWREHIPAICQQCAAFELCRAGCRANAAANQLKADPLACGPYSAMPELSPPIQISLNGESLPQARFSLRRESFGYVLINRSQILKVTQEAEPLIEVLQNGRMTLLAIKDLFGQEALNFVGLLYDHHMVELSEKTSSL